MSSPNVSFFEAFIPQSLNINIDFSSLNEKITLIAIPAIKESANTLLWYSGLCLASVVIIALISHISNSILFLAGISSIALGIFWGYKTFKENYSQIQKDISNNRATQHTQYTKISNVDELNIILQNIYTIYAQSGNSQAQDLQYQAQIIKLMRKRYEQLQKPEASSLSIKELNLEKEIFEKIIEHLENKNLLNYQHLEIFLNTFITIARLYHNQNKADLKDTTKRQAREKLPQYDELLKKDPTKSTQYKKFLTIQRQLTPPSNNMPNNTRPPPNENNPPIPADNRLLHYFCYAQIFQATKEQPKKDTHTPEEEIIRLLNL